MRGRVRGGGRGWVGGLQYDYVKDLFKEESYRSVYVCIWYECVRKYII